MATRSLFIFISLFILIVSGCKSDHIWNEESNRVSHEVTAMLKNYYKDINKDGIMAEFKYLDSSSVFSWHPPGYGQPISYDSVATILKQNATLYSSVQLQWDSLTVIPENASSARYIGKIRSIMTDTSGRADTFYLSEEGKLIKREDGWKLLSGKTVVL